MVPTFTLVRECRGGDENINEAHILPRDQTLNCLIAPAKLKVDLGGGEMA